MWSPHVVRSHDELIICVTQVCRVLETNSSGAWGSFMGFREVESINFKVYFVIEFGSQVQLLLEKLPLLHGVPGILRWMYRYIDRLLENSCIDTTL